MTDALESNPPELSRAAVLLLTTLRDYLDIPLYREGNEKARQEYRDLMEIRHVDALALLDGLLAVTEADALDAVEQLRELANDPPARYETHGGEQ